MKPDSLICGIDQALGIIGDVHRMTMGLKQIVYLVGWQHDGHDSQYPSWGLVNPRLKRPQDHDAAEGLRWLMAQAKAHNAVVSLHANMDDAYPNSPLWDEYIQKKLIVTRPDGSLHQGDVWGGEVSYHVCKPLEWAAGLGQRRIDRLLEMLPIRDAGTIHIDAFRPQSESLHRGISYEDELKTVKGIIAYWRSYGIDVTCEFLSSVELIGDLPMVYHLNMDEASRLKYPAGLICGGDDAWNRRHAILHESPGWPGSFCVPQAGCLYEEAWGRSLAMDLRGSQDYPLFTEKFHLATLPWLYMNRHRPIRHTHTRDEYRVEFSGGLVSSVRTADRHLTVRHGDRVLADGTNLFFPAFWTKDTWLAYSKTGGRMLWSLPEGWNDAKAIALYRRGESSGRRADISSDGALILDLMPGESVSVQAAMELSGIACGSKTVVCPVG